MSAGPMTLAERVRKISGFAMMAQASQELAQKARSDALEHAHWQAFDGAIAALLGLAATPEGQEALRQLEVMAVFDDAPADQTGRHSASDGDGEPEAHVRGAR